ncbi:MAG: ABC transporter permease [Planctomycetes bacterium]|nr:ABC transporter permease [Planctomycetota bacterium]
MNVPSLLERLRRLWARRETIRFLTSSNLKAGHRDKVLGHLWNLLDPLMFMLVYFFVFGVLFGLAGGGRGRSVAFMLYILVGILVFRFISGTINQAANCIRGNRGLIHEINFPKAVFPISVTLSRLYDFLWGTIVILVFLVLAGRWPTLHFLWLPLLVGLMVLFTMGTALAVAYLGAFFADTTNVVNVVLRLLFYCSPIFYYVRPKPGIPDKDVFLYEHETVHTLYLLNPIACFFETFRDALLWGDMPELRMLLYTAAVSIMFFIVGFALFSRGEGKFAKYI